MPTELDNLKAAYNRYRRQLEELEQNYRREATRLEGLMSGLRDVIQDQEHGQGNWTPGETTPQRRTSNVINIEKTPITRNLDLFLKETGRKSFHTPDLVRYLNSKGYTGKNLDSSVHETLRRQVAKGRLKKGDSPGEFAVEEQVEQEHDDGKRE